jgi:hypothetical protein
MPQRIVQMSDNLSAYDDLEHDAPKPPKRKTMIVLPIFVTLIVSAGATAIAWYSYNTGVREGSEGAAPLLKPEGPAKVTPKSPGGLAIPHQDKTVFQAIEGTPTDTRVERLLPPPESPAPLPAAPPTSATVGGSQVRQAEHLESPAEVSQNPTESTEANTEGGGVPGAPVRLTPGGEAASTPPPSLTEKRAVPKTRGNEPASIAMPAPVKPVPMPKSVGAMPKQMQSSKMPTVARATPKETVGTVPRSGYGIQIASLSSDASARVFWNVQKAKHKDLLGSLTLVVQTATVKGKTYHRVQGGSLKSRKSAADLCGALRKRGVGCVIVSFGQ